MPRHYLTLAETCSQVWCNKVSIALVLLAVKVYTFLLVLRLTLDHLVDLVSSLEDSYQQFSSAASTIPSQVSLLANKLVAELLQLLKLSAKLSLLLLATVIKALIGFYIEVFLGTFTCLLDAAAQGSVNMAVDATLATIKGVNATILAVTSEVESGLSAVSSFLENSVNTVLGLFTNGKKPLVATINLSLGKLKDLRIPDSVTEELDSFKLNLDEFDTLKNSTITLLTAPLTQYDKNVSALDVFRPINTSEMVVATNSSFAKDTLSDLSTVKSSVLHLREQTSRKAIIMIIVLLVLAVLVVCLFIWVERARFSQRNQFVLAAQALSLPTTIQNALEIYESRSMRHLSKLDISARGRWFSNYVTSKYALVAAAIGLAGILSFVLQYSMLLGAKQTLGRLGDSLESPRDSAELQKSLAQYTLNTNRYIKDQSDALNDELFGWYNKASSSVNDTLTDLLLGLNQTIHIVTRGTALAKPFEVVVYCVIGRKIVAVTKGITWLSNHLEIELPQLPKDLFTNVADAAPLDYSKQLKWQLKRGTNNLEHMLFIELYVALGFLGLWLLFVVVALALVVPRPHMKFKTPLISRPKLLTKSEREEYMFPVSSLHASLSVYSSLTIRVTS